MAEQAYLSSVEQVIITDASVVPEPLQETFVYWASKCSRASMAAEFNIPDLLVNVIPWSVLVDVLGDPPEFRYRFWGTERVRLIGYEMTGKTILDIRHAEMRDANLKEYQDVLRAKKPMLCQSINIWPSGRREMFQSMRLPISRDGHSVTQIYSIINFVEISAMHYKYFGTEIPLEKTRDGVDD